MNADEGQAAGLLGGRRVSRLHLTQAPPLHLRQSPRRRGLPPAGAAPAPYPSGPPGRCPGVRVGALSIFLGTGAAGFRPRCLPVVSSVVLQVGLLIDGHSSLGTCYICNFGGMSPHSRLAESETGGGLSHLCFNEHPPSDPHGCWGRSGVRSTVLKKADSRAPAPCTVAGVSSVTGAGARHTGVE